MSLQQALAHAAELHRGGHLAQARHLYRQILAIQPSFDAHYVLGILALQLGDKDEALACFDSALALRPDHAEAWNNRGGLLQQMNRPAEALASFDKALALRPGYAKALGNRGIALHMLKRFEEAAASFDRAVALAPDYAEAWNNRGNALQDLRQFAQALDSFDRALALDPAYADAWNNRGNTLWDMKRTEAALADYDRALALQPDFAKALYNRGTMQWTELRRLGDATRDLERVAALEPDYDYLQGALLHMRMLGADWRNLEKDIALVEAGIKAGKRTAEPFAYMTMSQSPALLQACARIYADDRYPPAPALWTRQRHEKIRLGYVCGEFREHATAYLIAGLFEAHDRMKFEIIAFDTGGSDASPMRRRLEAAFDKFIPLADLSDRQAAEKIHAEGIDILVNLNGYYGIQRMGVFAHKPAPIQVNFLGFPATLGASYIDYMIADRIVVPEGEQDCYTEKLVWLPDSYQVNDSRRPIADAPPRRRDHGLGETGLVFCAFNQSYKVTPALFEIWMRVLQQIEGSLLWLLEGDAEFSRNLKAQASHHGVAGERLVFAPHLPLDQHLARLRLADLFLDTLPCNAHTTASDALWAGLPLVTCRGKSFAGRVAASLLQAVGLPELIAEDLQAYEALILQLARDPARLLALRDCLGRNRATCSLFDTERFRRHLEAAYVQMSAIWQAGESPRNFTVAALDEP